MEKTDGLKSDGRILYRIIATVKPQLESISLEECEFKKSPDKWPKKEIVGHLIDSRL